MTKLTAKTRAKIPTREFAGPGRSYPVEDRAHAANAKARARQQEAKGNLAPRTMEHIIARANKVLERRK